MSTVQDMHINIDLELNKLNSNLYDNILPQEKDYFLNKAQERFIKQRYSPKSNNKGQGFEMSEKRIDDLRNLLVPNYYDKVYQLASDDFDVDSKARFYFPDDYMFLTSQRSRITYNPCGSVTPVIATEVFKVGTVTIPDLETYQYLRIRLGATVILDSTIAPELSTYSSEDKSLVIDLIITRLNTLLNDWEFYTRFKNISADIVVVSDSATVLSISYAAEASYTNINLVSTSFNYFTATGTRLVVSNRFAQQDDVYTMQEDPFNKTSVYDGPLTIIHNQSIDVFFDKFIVNEIAISYIRKPKLISLSLNQSCELAEHTHAEIVRDAVNLLLENFEAQNRLQTSLQVEATNE